MSHPKWLAWIDRRLTPARFTLALFACYVPWVAYSVWDGPGVHLAARPADDADSRPVVGDVPTYLREEIAHTGTPAQRAFASGAFTQGDSVEALIAAHPPSILVRHPPYVTLWYRYGSTVEDTFSPALEVVARDGRLTDATATIKIAPNHHTEANFFGNGRLGRFFLPDYSDYNSTLEVGIKQLAGEIAAAQMAVTGGTAAANCP